MSNEASPRPWKVDDSAAHERFGRKFVRIRDANGQSLTVEGKGRLFAEDAALIVDAVNERDRLRDLLRRTVETLEQVYKHADMTDYLRADVAGMQREAIAAIGEETR